jgi:hypothetical protein
MSIGSGLVPVETQCTATAQPGKVRNWVKSSKAQNEQKFSPVAPTADIGERANTLNRGAIVLKRARHGAAALFSLGHQSVALCCSASRSKAQAQVA